MQDCFYEAPAMLEAMSVHVQSERTVAASWVPTEHSLPMWDGTELFYRAWRRGAGSTRAVLLFHRGHEHSGRFQDLVDRLGLEGFDVFAWDARGHGRSPGKRGYAPGFWAMAKDMDSFVRGIAQRHQIAIGEMAIVAHSVGAVVAAAYVHDYAPPIRALVLATPAFRVKLYVPFAIPGLRLLHRVKPEAKISSYVKATMLTHDPAMAADYQRDPLISRDISNRILLEMYDTATRLIDDAAAIRVPTLVMSAGSDWVVDGRAQRRFFARLGSPVKRFVTLPGMYHAILHERERDQPIAEIRRFITEAFAAPRTDAAELVQHGDPSTRAAYARLERQLPLWSPKRWGFAAMRLSLKTTGRLSAGIRIGWRDGFDSGQSLDHVYLDRARGALLVGKAIDRIYLDGVGWQGIRQRKIHLHQRLQACFRELHALGRPVRLLDIAAGPGRYILDAIAATPEVAVTATLRDRDPGGVEAGRRILAGMGLSRVTYEQGDAFDGEAIARLEPKATIIVVSGLYELFADNALILRSLGGVARAIEPGGFLIYTNQPWHPQLELIARTLINRDQVPWIMRCRTQAEIDALVAEAGFEKVAMDIDRFGIFTVSVARRR